MENSSSGLKDKEVDKMLLDIGIGESEIFYSPIESFFGCWLLIICPILLSIGMLFNKLGGFTFIALIYPIITYPVISVLNRSFAITDKEVLIINSHFPFRKIERFQFDEVIEIKISSSWRLKPLMILLFLFKSNYVEIKTKTQKKRYYCLFLDGDCYDENWTEKTLDDLDRSLQLKGVNVKLEI